MDLLIPAIELHQAKLGRTPRLVAADAGFYSAKNEAAAIAKGVKRLYSIALPKSVPLGARRRDGSATVAMAHRVRGLNASASAATV